MKPSLQLKFSQQLTMTPQLQQAIKLLQLSTLDLQTEIQEALDSNPLLEMEEGSENDSNMESLNSKDKEGNEVETVSADSIESGDALEKNDLPDELPIDSTWDEYYIASSAAAHMSASSNKHTFFQG